MQDSSNVMKMTYQPQQRIDHILTATQASSLLQHLEICLQDNGCNHTHRFTQLWLDGNVSFMHHEAVLNELEDMGGYCDCEVLHNCYVDYEL